MVNPPSPPIYCPKEGQTRGKHNYLKTFGFRLTPTPLWQCPKERCFFMSSLIKPAIAQKNMLTFGHYPKEGGVSNPNPKVVGYFLLRLLYFTRSCITCINKSKMDGSFVSRSRSRSQIQNNYFYLEQDPYLLENASFTLTHIAVIMQLQFGVLP